jgi:hypothetical protein
MMGLGRCNDNFIVVGIGCISVDKTSDISHVCGLCREIRRTTRALVGCTLPDQSFKLTSIMTFRSIIEVRVTVSG